MTPSANGDGPGAEAAPIDELALLEALSVEVVDFRAFCPTCHTDLGDGGSVNWPHPTIADLEVTADGKVITANECGGEADVRSAECSSCGKHLDSTGWFS